RRTRRLPGRPRRRRAPVQMFWSSRARLLLDEATKMRVDLRDGADFLDVIQRDRDIEAVLELGDQLEDQQGIEAEIQYEIAVRRRFDRPAADPLHDHDDLRFERATGNAHRFLRIKKS